MQIENEPKVAFASNLRRLMAARRVNNVQLAQSIGVSHTTIGNYLEKGRVPKTAVLRKLAKFFYITVDDLLTGQDPGRRLKAAVALATAHPGNQEEKQALFERTTDQFIEREAHWRERAERAEQELSVLKTALRQLASESKPELRSKRVPAARKEKRARRLTDVAWVSVGLYECAAGGPLSPAHRIGERRVERPGRAYPAEALFALRLNGDSMDRADLSSGDVVLCVWAERREAEAGDIVVAHLRGDGCTLKRLHGPEGGRWLEPESANPAHARIALDGEGEPQAVIQAVMLRKLDVAGV